MNYTDFINTKIKSVDKTGIQLPDESINNKLYPFQKFILSKALSAGRYAIFADCGLGKTLMQLEWAHQISAFTNKPVLILAPLAVGAQTIMEGKKFGIDVSKLKDNDHSKGIVITNYEQLENIDCSIYSGIVLDESSILKNYSGVYKNLILQNFEKTPYKLACTATPSPNDELEIGNHAEFLNVMTSQDMRAMYFTTDKDIINGEKYRLKKHAIKEFYKWVSSWAIMISSPDDIGFRADKYKLPGLNYIEKTIITKKRDNGELFNTVSVSATDFNNELRLTKIERMDEAVKLVNESCEQFLIWIKHNEEGEYLRERIADAIEVKGSDTIEEKEKYLLGFANKEYRVLITKAKIAQYGLNFQNCFNQIFASLDFSFESMYQSIRRSYRYGQKHKVNIYLITTDTMQNVKHSIEDKQEKFIQMQNEMREAILSANAQAKNGKVITSKVTEFNGCKLINGDSVQEIKQLDDESIDYSFFSPPFGALYVFSDDPRDMSNVRDNDQFMEHFRYLANELYRVLKSGRLLSMHVMQSTTLLGRDGFYSIVDFRGDLIRLMQSAGFHFHAENMIRKDPKTAAIRTKNRQLMHGTTKKDSSIVRPGLADYIITFKKPGENKVPIQNNIPFDLWCKIAEPVWIDINESDTLDYRDARDTDDERHITATQLTPIEWCYNMWCNRGETVFSPFSGVASEGVVAIKTGRKYIGIELKKSYFDISVKNCRNAIMANNQLQLF